MSTPISNTYTNEVQTKSHAYLKVESLEDSSIWFCLFVQSLYFLSCSSAAVSTHPHPLSPTPTFFSPT